MGQPPPQPGPQGPFPGRPGHPPQGPPPGYGQQPPQGPPPGFAPQGPPPGYGQYPPQGPPPGYGPQGPGGPEQPKKKTGLIIGGAIGAVVLIGGIAGIAVWASGGEYVSMPDDCALVFEGNSLEDSDFGPLPSFDGGFDPDGGSSDGSYGEMWCEGESGDLMVSFHVELFDMEHPDTEEQLQELQEERFDPEGFGADSTEPGVVEPLESEYGIDQQILWEESSIGDRGMTVATRMDGGEHGGIGSFGASMYLSGNMIGTLSLSTSDRDVDIETLFAAAQSGASDLQSRVSRVAEK